MEAWSSGALDSRCRCADSEVHMYKALETRCRRINIEAWGSSALEARCGPCGSRDMEVRGLGVWKYAADVATGRYGGMEV